VSNGADDPQPFATERVGLTITGLDWGGDGPSLLYLHPNGFCSAFFDPLARRLTDAFRVVGIDLRAHGGSDEPPDISGYAYRELAADVLAALDHLGIDDVHAIGQSLGGGVAVIVDELAPGRIRRALLCEPIAFGEELVAERVEVSGGEPGPGDGGNYMSQIARKRRAVWPNRDSVRESYGSRTPFDVLDPEALDAYIRWGFVDRPDGQVELACSPEAEATLFEASGAEPGAPTAWAHLPDLRARTTIAAGTGTDLPMEWFRRQADRADAHFLEAPGGHFFLQEDVAAGVTMIRERLG
jgi:pimeloyl-ACP methyl ester carboxylesterase